MVSSVYSRTKVNPEKSNVVWLQMWGGIGSVVLTYVADPALPAKEKGSPFWTIFELWRCSSF